MEFIKRKILSAFRFLRQEDGSLKVRAVRSGVWTGLTGFLVALLAFLRSIVLARFLEPAMFGLMQLCLVIVNTINSFTRAGVAEALINKKGDIQKAQDVVFTILVIRGVVLSVLVFATASFVSSFYSEELSVLGYDENYLEQILWVMGLSFPMLAFANILTLTKARELNFRKISLLEQLSEFLNTVLVVILAIYLKNVWALVFGFVVHSVIYTLLSYVFLPGKPRFCIDWTLMKELLAYGKFITGISIILFVTSSIDSVIISKYLGFEQLGYYVLAYTTAGYATTMMVKLASRVLFPAYSEIQDDKEAVARIYKQVVSVLSFLLLPATIGMVLLADEIVILLFTEKWLPMADLLKILALFGLLRSYSTSNGYLFNGIARPDVDFYLSIVRLLVILALIFPFINNYGLEGVAWVMTISMFVHVLLGIIQVRRHVGIKYSEYPGIFFSSLWRTAIMGGVVLSGKYFLDLLIVTPGLPEFKEQFISITSNNQFIAEVLNLMQSDITIYQVNAFAVVSLIILAAAVYGVLSYKKLLNMLRL